MSRARRSLLFGVMGENPHDGPPEAPPAEIGVPSVTRFGAQPTGASRMPPTSWTTPSGPAAQGPSIGAAQQGQTVGGPGQGVPGAPLAPPPASLRGASHVGQSFPAPSSAIGAATAPTPDERVPATSSVPPVAAGPPRKGRPPRGGVGSLAAILALIAALLAVPAVTSWWLRSTLRGTDTWVEATAEIHQDREVAGNMASTMADSIASRADLSRESKERLADDLQGVVRGREFTATWRAGVRDAHRDVMRVADGHSTRKVLLQFDDLEDLMADAGHGYSIEWDEIGIIVVDEGYTSQIRSGSQLVGRATLILPILSLLLGVAAIGVAHNRLRLGAMMTLAVTVVAVVSALMTMILSGPIVNALVPSAGQEVTKDALGHITGSLVIRLVILVVVSGTAALVCWLLERRHRALQAPPIAFPGI